MPAIRTARKWLASRAPDFVYVPLVNLRNRLTGRKHRLKVAGGGLYLVLDDHDTIFVAQRIRHSRYKRGIRRFIESLAVDYNLHNIDVAAGGVFIDCGANIGELGYWARIRGLAYHAFEPESREATCCDLNNSPDQRTTNRCGLWSETTRLRLFSKAKSADSSFIEIADYDEVTLVSAVALDDYVVQCGIQAIEVLKVEAEGAEPEVLRGARESLKISRYVAVDCGPERGLSQEDTVRDVCNAMYAAGFQMIFANARRVCLLFENRNCAMRAAA